VNPGKIIDDLSLLPQMAVADFGCGSGHYVIEAARRVGKAGKVYAIDVQKEMLGYVRSQAASEGLSNIETIWADLELAEASRLKNDSIDLIIISNILFQAENKSQIAKEAHRILKKGGKTAIIEWDIEKQSVLSEGEASGEPKAFGPAMDARISPQAAKDLFVEIGFAFEKEFNPGDHHYGIVFRK